MQDLGVFGGLVAETSKGARPLVTRRRRSLMGANIGGAMLGAPGSYNLDMAAGTAAAPMALSGAPSGAEIARRGSRVRQSQVRR